MQPCLVIQGNKCSHIPENILFTLQHKMWLAKLKTQNGGKNTLLTFFLARLNVQWFPNGFPEVPVETTSRGPFSVVYFYGFLLSVSYQTNTHYLLYPELIWHKQYIIGNLNKLFDNSRVAQSNYMYKGFIDSKLCFYKALHKVWILFFYSWFYYRPLIVLLCKEFPSPRYFHNPWKTLFLLCPIALLCDLSVIYTWQT